jgi:TolB-like protein
LAALAALLAAAGAWLALGHLGNPAGSRIAILPFETTDSDASSRSLADGVGDEVARTMTSVGLPTLSLDVGRAGNGEERDETAVKGGAAYALGGHVQRDGGALNVSVHIGDPRTHAILWSKNFSRPAAEAGAMREQVATTTVRVLQCAFDVINLPASRFDNETVGLYLRACDLRPDYDSQDQVRDLLRQVTQRQPRFATGWAKLALAAPRPGTPCPPTRPPPPSGNRGRRPSGRSSSIPAMASPISPSTICFPRPATSSNTRT